MKELSIDSPSWLRSWRCFCWCCCEWTLDPLPLSGLNPRWMIENTHRFWLLHGINQSKQSLSRPNGHWPWKSLGMQVVSRLRPFWVHIPWLQLHFSVCFFFGINLWYCEPTDWNNTLINNRSEQFMQPFKIYLVLKIEFCNSNSSWTNWSSGNQSVSHFSQFLTPKGYSHTRPDGMCRSTGCPFTVKIMRQGTVIGKKIMG